MNLFNFEDFGEIDILLLHRHLKFKKIPMASPQPQQLTEKEIEQAENEAVDKLKKLLTGTLWYQNLKVTMSKL